MKLPPKKEGVRGRFVGLICPGKEKYQAAMIETLDGVVTSVTPLGTPSTTSTNKIVGDSIHVAWMAVQLGMAKWIRDKANDLWPKEG